MNLQTTLRVTHYSLYILFLACQLLASEGQCLCGGVQFSTHNISKTLKDHELYACHCGMCRRWCGGMPLACMEGRVNLKTATFLRWYKSSNSAYRGFCVRCGTKLFWLPQKNLYTYDCCIAFGILNEELWVVPFHIYAEERPFFYKFKNEKNFEQKLQICGNSGACLCGKTTFLFLDRPRLFFCHCKTCRRWNGGMPLALFSSKIALQNSTTLKWWVKNKNIKYGFCSSCGTSLFLLKNGVPYSSVGLIKDNIKIEGHLCESEKAPFYDIIDRYICVEIKNPHKYLYRGSQF